MTRPPPAFRVVDGIPAHPIDLPDDTILDGSDDQPTFMAALFAGVAVGIILGLAAGEIIRLIGGMA